MIIKLSKWHGGINKPRDCEAWHDVFEKQRKVRELLREIELIKFGTHVVVWKFSGGYSIDNMEEERPYSKSEAIAYAALLNEKWPSLHHEAMKTVKITSGNCLKFDLYCVWDFGGYVSRTFETYAAAREYINGEKYCSIYGLVEAKE